MRWLRACRQMGAGSYVFNNCVYARFRFLLLHARTPSIRREHCVTTPCRYVRLTVLEPYLLHGDQRTWAKVGLAEIERLFLGENVTCMTFASHSMRQKNVRLEIPYRRRINLCDSRFGHRDYKSDVALLRLVTPPLTKKPSACIDRALNRI